MLPFGTVIAIAVFLTILSNVSASVIPNAYYETKAVDNCNGPISHLEPRYFQEYGSERVKITYGPFAVPCASTNGGLLAFTIGSALKPCDDCLITTFQGGLEYPGGCSANLNESMMLHHMVTMNDGRKDTVCPKFTERVFATGNERLAIELSGQGHVKAGYYLSADTISIQAELLNLGDSDQNVYLSVDWEYIPNNYTEFKRLRPLWLDASGNCGETEVPVPDGTCAFNLSQTPAFTIPWDAFVGGVGGHIYDGGVDLQVTKNEAIVCDMKAGYGGPGYTDPSGMEHVSSLGVCHNVGPTKAGDKWSVTANYDFNQHAPMMEGDAYAPVMGVALAYVTEPRD